MNFVKERLTTKGKGDSVSLVEFNPWLVNNDEALLREFFKTIMTYPDQTVRRLFKQYGALAIFASKTIVNTFSPSVGSALAKGIKWAQKAIEDSQDTLAELKKKVSDAIIASKRHLIVMIDDVDRLDKEELHTVLRLIRQVADFQNCIYIVAMDVDMVSNSICDFYGHGTIQDGRHFLDKIVQIPITIPLIPQADMLRLVEEELANTLDGYIEKDMIKDIAGHVVPFMATYRDLKRYCNQLAFVLPHLKDEVSIKDLCLIEAIKIVSAQSYNRIHERRAQLMREVNYYQQQLKEERIIEETNKNYEEAKEYITKEMSSGMKERVEVAIDALFGGGSLDHMEDLDKKRFFTEEYFSKYFALTVPSDLIPDRGINDVADIVGKGDVDALVAVMNVWLEKYSASEVKRASLSLIRKFPHGDAICSAASVVAKALSISRLAKGLPPHVCVDHEVVAAFVPNQIIYRYMFVQDENNADMNVWDADKLDDTLAFILTNGELDYCLNFLCYADYIFRNGIYNGHNVLLILIKRFTKLSVEEQFKYSKVLLFTLLSYWERVDTESFNAYARNLFVNPVINCATVFNKFIHEGQEELQDLANFVGLFKLQIPQILERIQGESEDVKQLNSVRRFMSNYKPLLAQ